MHLWQIIVLAVVQGLAELLPISSSAHVIVAEKLMGLDPTAPEMTLLLVMLHSGTMLAVIVYFWRRWFRAFFQSAAGFKNFVVALIVATFCTGVVGLALIEIIEKVVFRHQAHAWVEELFGRLDLIAMALAAGGILILVAGLRERRAERQAPAGASEITVGQSFWIGIVQGLCVPFRGFSRSGATISTGLLQGVARMRAEDFSFALAVILTPAADAREALRLVKTHHGELGPMLHSAIVPSLLGAFFAFLAGLVALKWLSRWLETGRWFFFGVYCLLTALVVGLLYFFGV
jgi:undecaprenyl-diphosphatase